MTRPKVLARRSRPTTKSYRTAVKEIVLAIQADHKLNDSELAERLGCSAGTVENARKEMGNLNGVTLANIEYEFGPSALDPFLELGGSRAIPIAETTEADGTACLSLSVALTSLIEAQSPSSEGGPKITQGELARRLSELKRARGALDALIEQAENGPVRELRA